MLFESREIERVLRLQQQSYGLLKWLNQHLRRGSLSFSVVHGATSGPAAAEEWLARNRAHFPPALLPADSERQDFAHLLTSYLLTSFELPAGKVSERISECSCYCDYCSYVVALHRLLPRQPASQGSALLVLWRDIAWEDGRKPRKNFELTAAHVLESEQTLRTALSTLVTKA